MFALKKFAPLLALLALSCGKHNADDFDDDSSSVTFFNTSSYTVSVHAESFSGPVLVDKLASGMSHSTTLNPSDNHGSGSTFSVEYFILIANYAECSCGDVWISGIDPNVQISRNIEVGESYVIEIPQPKLELKRAFLKIRNTSSKPFELSHGTMRFRQAGNGEFPVPSGKVGVYEMEDSKNEETEIKDYYTIIQTFEEYPFPEFMAKNGYIYSFEFDGNSVTAKGEQKITF